MISGIASILIQVCQVVTKVCEVFDKGLAVIGGAA